MMAPAGWSEVRYERFCQIGGGVGGRRGARVSERSGSRPLPVPILLTLKPVSSAPLIEPGVRISRLRLPDRFHTRACDPESDSALGDFRSRPFGRRTRGCPFVLARASNFPRTLRRGAVGGASRPAEPEANDLGDIHPALAHLALEFEEHAALGLRSERRARGPRSG